MVHTRQELLEIKRANRLKNLALYHQALKKVEEEELQEQTDIEWEKQQENERRLKERQERQNRFRRSSEEKRQRKNAIIEQQLGFTLEEHKQIVNKRIEQLKQEERDHQNEMMKVLQMKRNKKLQEIRSRVKPEKKVEQEEQPSPIEKKVNNWYDEFKKAAGGRTGTDFYAWSKSEDGAPIFEEVLQKYRHTLSRYNRKNKFIQTLRKELFQKYNVNII